MRQRVADIAVVAECTVVDHVINAFCCKLDPYWIWALLLPPFFLFCLLWATSSVHWRMIVTTTVPPFGDHGKPWAIPSPACVLLALPPQPVYKQGEISREAKRSPEQLHRNTILWDQGPLSVVVIFFFFVAQMWYSWTSQRYAKVV